MDPLQALTEGVAIAERWRAARGGEWSDGLDQSRLAGPSGTVADFAVADIEGLVGRGHTVSIGVRDGFQFARRVTAQPHEVAGHDRLMAPGLVVRGPDADPAPANWPARTK